MVLLYKYMVHHVMNYLRTKLFTCGTMSTNKCIGDEDYTDYLPECYLSLKDAEEDRLTIYRK
jgi:hypothetical protein